MGRPASSHSNGEGGSSIPANVSSQLSVSSFSPLLM